MTPPPHDRFVALIVDLLHNDHPEGAWDLVGAHLCGPVIGAELSAHTTLDQSRRLTLLTRAYPLGAARQSMPGPAGFPLGTDDYTWRRFHAAKVHPAARASDWIPLPRWRRTPTFTGLNGYFGVTHLMIVPLTPGAAIDQVLGIARTDRDFDDTNLEAATRLAPLLIGLEAHLHQLGCWRAAIAPAAATLKATPEQLAAEVKLTPRELVVLAVLAEGLRAPGIAARLAISPRTVDKHLENIHRKLGATSHTSTLVRARALGLLPAEGTR